MSVKVAGLWEMSWNNPLSESWMWTFPLREFGIMEWAMSPVTGILHVDACKTEGINLTEYNSVEDMLEEFSGNLTRVYVDENGEVLLNEFEHPEDAVYIFGNVGRSLWQQFKRPSDFSVRIPTVINTGVMWPHQCLVTVLHDRLIKNVSTNI